MKKRFLSLIVASLLLAGCSAGGQIKGDIKAGDNKLKGKAQGEITIDNPLDQLKGDDDSN